MPVPSSRPTFWWGVGRRLSHHGVAKWEWGWGPQDDYQSIRTIEKAIEIGINWIDTAPVYGLGHSEKIVGKAIQNKRDRLFIATKCGQIWNLEGEISFCLNASSVRKEVDSSLRRLGLENIDLYQIHWPKPNKDIEEAFMELVKLKAEGKVRNIGVSNFDVSQLKRVLRIAPVFSNQVLYNMFDTEIEREILPFCNDHNINVIVYSPMASGLLTGKYNQKTLNGLDKSDWRTSEKGGHFLEPEFSINIEIINDLRAIASKMNIGLCQLALAWILNNKKIAAAIAGVRSQEQILQTSKASSIRLSQDTIEKINRLLEKRKKQLSISITQDH